MRRKCEYDGCGNYAVCLDKNNKYACGIHAVTDEPELKDIHCVKWGRCKATVKCPLEKRAKKMGYNLVIMKGGNCVKYPKED